MSHICKDEALRLAIEFCDSIRSKTCGRRFPDEYHDMMFQFGSDASTVKSKLREALEVVTPKISEDVLTRRRI